MSSTPEKQGFWTGLRATIAVITALITATGSVLGVVLAGRHNGTSTATTTSQVTTSTTMSHEQWVTAAGKICSQLYQDATAIAPPNDPAGAAQYWRRSALALSRAVTGLNALAPPTADAPRAQEAIRNLSDAGMQWTRIANAYDNYLQDPQTAQQQYSDATATAQSNLQRAGEVFVSLGADGCSGTTTR